MNSLKFKVKGYDEATGSLIICFASDTTSSQDPESYPPLAFQPLNMWPDVNDVEELKIKIAQSGLQHVVMQERKEKFVVDTDRINELKSLVGKTYEFSVEQLTQVQEEVTPLQTV